MTHTTMSLMKFMQELQNFIWMQDVKCSCRDELRKGWFAWNGEMLIDLAKYPCRHPILRVIIDLEKPCIRAVYSYKKNAILVNPEHMPLEDVLRVIERHMVEHSMH